MSLLQRATLVLTLLAAATFTPTAKAQFSVYATYSGTHLSNIVNGNTPGLNSTYTTGSYWCSGLGIGVSDELIHAGPAAIGLDLRVTAKLGTTGAASFAGGPKVAFNLPQSKLKLYAEATAGIVRSSVTVPIGTDTEDYTAFQVLGGADYELTRIVHLRLIEIGGGVGTHTSGPDNSGNTSILSVNSGIVLSF